MKRKPAQCGCSFDGEPGLELERQAVKALLQTDLGKLELAIG
ncbi:MAG: hypothetical protein FD135_4498 [Comamonadaceae bacterium]|nr:MAG: hypothetical protein FD135_4498 [Comamonadaceae bacterium]